MAAVDHIEGYGAKVTVVTVCRNAASCIDMTAASVAAQCGVLLEWLVIDGLSVDDTVSRVEHHSGSMSGRVRIVSESDLGIYDAMNKGLRLAKGEWVLFLNAGDSLVGDAALSAMLAATQKGLAMVTGRVRMRDPADGYQRVQGAPFCWKAVADGKVPPHPGCLYHRATACRIGGFDMSAGIAADTLLTLKLGAVGKTAFVNQVVAVFPTDGVSSRFDWRWRVHRDKARAIKAAAPAWVWRRYRWRWPVEALRATASHLLRKVGLLVLWRRIKGAR